MKKSFFIYILFPLLLTAAFPLTASGVDALFKYIDEKYLGHLKNPDAAISICYKLEKSRWIEFNLPPAIDNIKIITNANIPGDASYDPGAQLNYLLEYRIQDKQKQIIKSGKYGKRSQITKYIVDAQGKESTSSYYFSEPLIPADGRVTILNFKGIALDKDLVIGFRLVHHDPLISDVVMRFYFPETTPEEKLKHQWKRTGKEKKKYLARSNVYPEEFLTEKEQINLMRKLWRPLAPVGIEGRDYQYRKLYVAKEIEGIPVGRNHFQKGMLMDQHLRRTFPIPENGLSMKFVFFRPPSHENNPPPSIQLKWFGKRMMTHSWNIPWKGEETEFEKSFEGGVIELSCDRPVTFVMYRFEMQQELEITPDPMRTRAFLIDAAKPLTYRISHVKGLPTPFRVGIRKQMDDFEAVTEKVHYVLLDENENHIKRDGVTVKLLPSLYDRSREKENLITISDPHFLHFRLPRKVAYIRFTSSSAMLINAYNRSPHMVKLTTVPEDYFKSEGDDHKKRITWFPLYPLNYTPLLKQQRAVTTLLQHRPPKINLDLYSGRFRWESLEPGKNAKGHYILMPLDEKPYQRDAALISTFRNIPGNVDLKVQLKSAGMLEMVRPKLVFYKKDGSFPFSVDIAMDGKGYYQKELAGSTGILSLPPVSRGSHRISLHSSAAVQWYMNQIVSQKSGFYMRFAHHLTRKGLTLNYTKLSHGDETLSLALSFPMIHPERLLLSIELQGPSLKHYGPHDSFSLFKRQYSVRSDHNGPIYVLNSSIPVMGSWQRCFFPLRSDLNPGRYRIKLSLDKGEKAYVVPYRVIPGIHPQRKILKEARS